MTQLRKTIAFEEFDYQALLDCLKDYKKPRDKISQLLEKGDIVRVKKGLYVFGEEWRRQPVSLEVLANLIYGPSYLSREYALSHYRLIPEAVYTLTSMTAGRKKLFQTPLGAFSYEHLAPAMYSAGVTLQPIDGTRMCLFATAEKALIDTIYLTPGIASVEQMLEHLTDNMRIDEDGLKDLDYASLQEIASLYKNSNVKLLSKAIGSL